jgi:hypothetical protein
LTGILITGIEWGYGLPGKYRGENTPEDGMSWIKCTKKERFCRPEIFLLCADYGRIPGACRFFSGGKGGASGRNRHNREGKEEERWN